MIIFAKFSTKKWSFHKKFGENYKNVEIDFFQSHILNRRLWKNQIFNIRVQINLGHDLYFMKIGNFFS